MTIVAKEYSIDDLTFSIAFCIGIIRYLSFTYRRNEEDSVEMYNAISQGMLNAIRIILLSSFVPIPIRIIVPMADLIGVLIQLAIRWQNRKMRGYNSEKKMYCGICNLPNCSKYREMERVHVE